MKTSNRLALGTTVILSLVLIAALWARMHWTGDGRAVRPPEEGPDSAESAPPELEGIKTALMEEGPRETPPAFEGEEPFGWTVWGKVTLPLREPLEGARVVLRLFDGQRDLPPIDPVFTDFKGRYITRLPAPASVQSMAPDAVLPMEVYAFATLKGHRPGYHLAVDLPHPERGNDPLRLDIMLKPGGSLTGLVRTPEGEPVVGAEIHLLLPDLDWKKATESGPGGAWAVPVGEPMELHACALKFDEGLATPVALEVDPSRETRAPDLVLEPFQLLEGKAVYPDGRPLDRMEIHAVPSSLAGAPAARLLDHADRFLNKRDLPPGSGAWQGLPFGRARTAPDGRFRMQGLAPGDYLLWVPELHDTVPQVVPQADALRQGPRLPCRAGDRDLELVIDCYRIKVVLEDEAGLLLPVVHLSFESDTLDEGELVLCGEIFKQVAPGERLQLTAVTEDGRFAAETVLIRDGVYEVERALVLKDRPPDGLLRLQILGPDALPLDPVPPAILLLSGKVESYQVKLQALRPEGPGLFLLSLFPDRYEAFLMADPSEEGTVEKDFIPAEAEDLVITSGRTANLSLGIRWD